MNIAIGVTMKINVEDKKIINPALLFELLGFP